MKNLLLIMVVLFAGCVSGGPCTYDNIPFTAKIVSIKHDTTRSVYRASDTSRKDFYAVKMATNIPAYKNTYLDEMLGRSITKEFITKHQLIEGKILEGTAHLIISGSCHPGHFYFADSTLNPYQQ